jgi:hypothetical protein
VILILRWVPKVWMIVYFDTCVVDSRPTVFASPIPVRLSYWCLRFYCTRVINSSQESTVRLRIGPSNEVPCCLETSPLLVPYSIGDSRSHPLLVRSSLLDVGLCKSAFRYFGVARACALAKSAPTSLELVVPAIEENIGLRSFLVLALPAFLVLVDVDFHAHHGFGSHSGFPRSWV